MVRVPIKQARSIQDLYRQLVAGQKQAHGPDYCRHHDAIRRLADPEAVYAEIGVNQGATLACAILAGFREVVGVDTRLELLEPCRKLFAHPTCTLLEQDAEDPLPFPVDVLLLDAQHTVAAVAGQLRAHGANVRHHIVIHDTAAMPALHVEACYWASCNRWAVAERSMASVGFTLLSR